MNYDKTQGTNYAKAQMLTICEICQNVNYAKVYKMPRWKYAKTWIIPKFKLCKGKNYANIWVNKIPNCKLYQSMGNTKTQNIQYCKLCSKMFLRLSKRDDVLYKLVG